MEIHRHGRKRKISDGDIIVIHDNNLSGAEVSLSVSGYTGSITIEIPPS